MLQCQGKNDGVGKIVTEAYKRHTETEIGLSVSMRRIGFRLRVNVFIPDNCCIFAPHINPACNRHRKMPIAYLRGL